MRTQLQSSGSHFDRIAEEMWEMLNEEANRSFFRSDAPRSWRPNLNVYEAAERYLVCVELAGMERDQIEIHFQNGVLHVRGSRKKPECADTPAGTGVVVMEIDSGSFHRTVSIPGNIAVDRINAWYRQGYVWIVLPRVDGGPLKKNA